MGCSVEGWVAEACRIWVDISAEGTLDGNLVASCSVPFCVELDLAGGEKVEDCTALCGAREYDEIDGASFLSSLLIATMILMMTTKTNIAPRTLQRTGPETEGKLDEIAPVNTATMGANAVSNPTRNFILLFIQISSHH